MSLKPVFQIFYPILDCDADRSDFTCLNGWKSEFFDISRKLTSEAEYNTPNEEPLLKNKKRNSPEGGEERNEIINQVFKLEYTYDQNLSNCNNGKWTTPEKSQFEEGIFI